MERYRLLARAAIRHGLSSLYLGHHQDDQVENFLMRLTQSDHGIDDLPRAALIGMRETSGIPCCNDIYGAVDSDSRGYPHDATVQQAHQGLTIVRPFLAYPKARLIATCEKMEVPFFIDETNLEPKRTRRNAVRHLMTHYRLPRALQRANLVNSQNKVRRRVLNLDEFDTQALLRRLNVRRFDIRSCLLSVEFPQDLDKGLQYPFAAVANVLKIFLDAVSPLPRGPIPLSADIVDHIVKILTQGIDETSRMQSSTVTTAGVLIKPGFRTLQVCREPLRRGDHAKLTSTFAAPRQPDPEKSHSWTEWLFWDNRYWIRIKLMKSEDPRDYTVRAFTEADIAPVKASLQDVSSERLRAFQDLLEAAAPGKIRFTLPVIVKGGHVAAFPTLNIVLPNMLGQMWHHPSPSDIPWQVRLKHQTRPVREACARRPIALGNPTGAPGSSINLTFASPGWMWGKVDELKLKSTRDKLLVQHLKWLQTLAHDVPAEEFERHTSIARQRYAR